MIQGFKDFISKGNVMDLAVAVIIGAAFGKVIDALVGSVIMPAIAMLVGTPNFDDWLVFGSVKVGVFLTAVVNFLLIAAAVYFCIVMPMNKMIERRNRKLGIEPEDEAVDPQIQLLTEIRDALNGTARGSAGDHVAR
ncbi:mechanosensitive ion channel protein MscL [Arthrobacter sp. HMSC06H05]|uniref:large conductance mechanosensitive channel protein MscL n=1 Tax=Arthrobacter sp. HMSC06H05 TaxID=1581128 RepID=UPI0008A4D1AE|nr:large conductance mechanosensitive channel protein MscL [Arthrobacter sp. HMSC06H05]OFT40527.1 mechanosensitive ion channel protein MscL [Arthrobacter sp. HMSC06H05]